MESRFHGLEDAFPLQTGAIHFWVGGIQLRGSFAPVYSSPIVEDMQNLAGRSLIR